MRPARVDGMIVGVGMLGRARHLLDRLRGLVDHPNIYIFPEFFDSKKELIERRYATYVQRLLRYRDRVVIALWPDYLYVDRFSLCKMDIVWVFPIHYLSEFEKLPRCIEVVGYAADPKYREYRLEQFIDVARERGFAMWWLGASKREIGIATALGFWGLDVNTGSTGLPFRAIRSPEFPRLFADFLYRVANNEYRSGVLLKWI